MATESEKTDTALNEQAPESSVLTEESVSPDAEDSPIAMSEPLSDEADEETKPDEVDTTLDDDAIDPEAEVSSSDDKDEQKTSDADFMPADDIPPIQDALFASDDAEPVFPAPDEDDRPWEATAIKDEDLKDFVWEDPTDPETGDPEPGHTDEDEQPVPADESATFEDATNGALEEIDDSDIARALKAQMEVEDQLEKNPKPAQRDIEAVPAELGGLRSRAPDLDALKSSVRAKSVDLTKDELQEAKPARRFRRGFVLTLVLFTAFAAVYVLRGKIVEALPAALPYLETYAALVDTLRAQAEVLTKTVWTLVLQGFDWVMAKISG